MPTEGPDVTTVVYVVAGCAVLTLLGIAIPAGAQAIQPSGEFLEVQEVEVDNVSADGCTAKLTTSYWGSDRRFYQVDTTLYAAGDDGEASRAVETWSERAALPGGVHTITFTRETEEPLSFGRYYYEFQMHFETEYGWDKSTTAQSETIAVHHGNQSDEQPFPSQDSTFSVIDTGQCVG